MIRELVHLHAVCKVNKEVSVDIPYTITRDAKTKNIETKHMKKDYKIVYITNESLYTIITLFLMDIS